MGISVYSWPPVCLNGFVSIKFGLRHLDSNVDGQRDCQKCQ